MGQRFVDANISSDRYLYGSHAGQHVYITQSSCSPMLLWKRAALGTARMARYWQQAGVFQRLTARPIPNRGLLPLTPSGRLVRMPHSCG